MMRLYQEWKASWFAPKELRTAAVVCDACKYRGDSAIIMRMGKGGKDRCQGCSLRSVTLKSLSEAVSEWNKREPDVSPSDDDAGAVKTRSLVKKRDTNKGSRKKERVDAQEAMTSGAPQPDFLSEGGEVRCAKCFLRSSSRTSISAVVSDRNARAIDPEVFSEETNATKQSLSGRKAPSKDRSKRLKDTPALEEVFPTPAPEQDPVFFDMGIVDE